MVRRARRGLVVYLALVAVGSAALETWLIRRHRPVGAEPWPLFALMWTPAVASLIARLALREGFADVSFRPGGRRGLRSMAVAWGYPFAVCALAYGVAWTTGLARFYSPPLLGATSPAASFALRLATHGTVGVLANCLSAAGEEFGWRGYLLTRLIDARVPRPVLACSLIWGAWHVPLIVAGVYASGPRPSLSVALFLVDVTAAGYVAARLRLASGSVWPAVLFHGAWNAIVQGAFDGSTVSGSPWVGESGVLVAAANLLLAVALVRGRWQIRRTPSDPPVPLAGAA